MPREVLTIKSFDKGLVTNADPKDLGDGVCVYSDNISPASENGLLRSIRAPKKHTALAGAQSGRVLMYEADKYMMVIDKETQIRALRNFYGTIVDQATNYAGPATCYVPYGQTMYVGRGTSSPIMMGHVDRQKIARIDNIAFVATDDILRTNSDAFPEILISGNFTGIDTMRIYNPLWDSGTSTVSVEIKWASQGSNDDITITRSGGISTETNKWSPIKRGGYNTGLYIRVGAFNTATSGSGYSHDVYFDIEFKNGVSAFYADEQNIHGKTADDPGIAGTYPTLPAENLFYGRHALEKYHDAGLGFSWLGTTDNYGYYFSILFDGTQETTLKYIGSLNATASNDTVPRIRVMSRCQFVPGDPDEGTFSMYQSRRVSGVNVYRAKSGEYPRLVYSFPTASGLDVDGLSEYVSVGTGIMLNMVRSEGTIPRVDLHFEVYDYGVSTGATYEVNTGISHTVSDVAMPTYTCADIMDGFMLIGGCTQSLLTDAPKMIFRSKQFRHSMFDWTTDFQILSFVPTAISHFKNRWVVFGPDQLAIINNNNLMVEEVKDGCGAINQFSVVSIGEMLIWCNRDNVFMLAEGLKTISDSIKDLSLAYQVSWRSVMASGNVKVAYNSRDNYVIFMNETSGKMFVYSIKNDRWDYWISEDVAKKGLFEGKPGYVYYAKSNGDIMQLEGSTDPEIGTTLGSWYSPLIDFGEPNQKKRFHEVYVDYASGEAIESILVDGNAVTLPAYGNNIQVRLTSIYPGTIVRGIEIQYRRMEGKR